MVIDIISYADAQFSGLTSEQLLEVKNVQAKKDRLTERLAEDKRSEKYRLIAAGTFRSSIYQKICEVLDKAYEREVEILREGLLFYLQFSGMSTDKMPPYTVDFSLSYEERVRVVVDYYEEAYATPYERYVAFKLDEFAKGYLGEYYAATFDYFAVQAG